MCSIYGIMYYNTCQRKIIENKMAKMSKATLHRGPDEKEIMYFENSAIGMNRLSIINPNYQKAMVQKDGDYYSVFNGEITNFKKLSKNINQDIKCDSEIILPLFRKYNEKFIEKLGGMFSISIYDNINKSFNLWRDPLGIKPLYYYSNNEFFIFSSEIKAIYSTIEKKPKLNFNVIDNILRYGFNPGRDTVFNGIKKVLPGENLTVYNGKIEFKKYWNLKNNVNNVHRTEEEKIEIKNNFKKLLNEIVEENAYSDVPGGFFLSGGLDSSLVTAIAMKNKNSNYKIPISIRFSPNSVDDEKYVKILEQYFGKKVEWVDITPDLARNTLEELVKYIDEPLENPTHVGTYLMSKKAKELGLKTVITGDGSDELFIGYERQECWIKNDKPKDVYPKLSCKISKEILESLYKPEYLEIVKEKRPIPESITNMDDALKYERGERLPEYHNMRLDRMTMAQSIEAKVPFEDYRIADFSFNLSVSELMQGERKGWLKEISKEWLPDEIIYRKKAIFPSLPNEWISGKGIDWCKNILLASDSKIKTFFKIEKIEDLIEEHSNGKEKRGKELWALITLELWLKNIENWK